MITVSAIFCEIVAVFLLNQCHDPNFKTSRILHKKAQIFLAKIFLKS
jgi:hypothetical protein